MKKSLRKIAGACDAQVTDAPSSAIDAEVISAYSRQQAVKDGVLVDVSEAARDAGIRYPVAVTSGVWYQYVELTPAAEGAGNDMRGRIWDIVWMLRWAIQQHRGTSEFLYELVVVTDSLEPSTVTLKAMCGPGDDGEPVITVLLPNED